MRGHQKRMPRHPALPGGYFFFAPVTAGVREALTVGGASSTFLGCFGFFASRLLRCWPLAMIVLLKEFARDKPGAQRDVRL
jgi:hypothetical protein